MSLLQEQEKDVIKSKAPKSTKKVIVILLSLFLLHQKKPILFSEHLKNKFEEKVMEMNERNRHLFDRCAWVNIISQSTSS